MQVRLKTRGFNPWVGKIPWRRPIPVFLPGEPHGQRSLAGCGPWDHDFSWTQLKHSMALCLNPGVYTHTQDFQYLWLHIFRMQKASQIIWYLQVSRFAQGKNKSLLLLLGFTGGSAVKNPPAMQETWVQSLGQQSLWRRKWQPTPVFLPGESHGQRSLMGCGPWGHDFSWTWLKHSMALCLLLPSRFSRVCLCVTPQTAAHQASLSLGFSILYTYTTFSVFMTAYI